MPTGMKAFARMVDIATSVSHTTVGSDRVDRIVTGRAGWDVMWHTVAGPDEDLRTVNIDLSIDLNSYDGVSAVELAGIEIHIVNPAIGLDSTVSKFMVDEEDQQRLRASIELHREVDLDQCEFIVQIENAVT